MKIALVFLVSIMASITWADNYSLNHLSFRLDIQTVKKIAKSDFLQNEFSDFYAGESGDSNNKWTAIYIQGKETYLEIYDSNGSVTKANVGIAFASNTLGAIENMINIFTSRCTQPLICEVESRVKKENDPVWFKQLKWLDRDETLDTWVMEYGYEYVTAKPTAAGSVWAVSNISTTRYNSEWYKEDRLMKNIESIDLTVTTENYERIVNVAQVMGYELVVKANKSLLKIGGKTRFRLVYGNTVKVNNIMFSLNKNVKKRSFVMGASTLMIEGETAVWSFD